MGTNASMLGSLDPPGAVDFLGGLKLSVFLVRRRNSDPSEVLSLQPYVHP